MQLASRVRVETLNHVTGFSQQVTEGTHTGTANVGELAAEHNGSLDSGAPQCKAKLLTRRAGQ